jgi:hypothetical protein
MPIKKCKYCKTRMNKVVWGMPSQDDYENADDFTEFRGCIITEPTESWRCDFCDSKIIPSHTPKSGLCLEEAPDLLLKALEIFANRLNKFSKYVPGGTSPDPGAPVTLNCTGSNSDLSPFNIPEHSERGDYLSLRICNNLKLMLFFNGTSQVFIQWAALITEYGKFEETQIELQTPRFSNLETKLEDLISGYDLLLSVLDEIPKHYGHCTGYECDHNKGFLWEGLEEVVSRLDVESARLNRNFHPTSFQRTLST